MKRDGRNLVKQFRALAPPRHPISLQRWNLKRILLTLGLVLGVFVTLEVAFIPLLSPSYSAQLGSSPRCTANNETILMAQAVPTATLVPCVASLPSGWTFGGLTVRRGFVSLSLNSDRGGTHALEATLRPPSECLVAGATEVPSDQPGMRRFERTLQLPPNLRTTRYYLFEGGCVTYRFSLNGPSPAALVFAGGQALGFEPRETLIAKVHHDSGLRLCGADVACPGDRASL